MPVGSEIKLTKVIAYPREENIAKFRLLKNKAESSARIALRKINQYKMDDTSSNLKSLIIFVTHPQNIKAA